jgi:hypothetical protein
MGVHPFEVGLAVRRWQCRKDQTYLPPSLPEVFSTAHTQAVHKVKDLRKSVGLPEQPPSVVTMPEAMKRFQEMLRATKIVQDNDFVFKAH